jgi:type VI secretion system secreted protein Hcp
MRWLPAMAPRGISTAVSNLEVEMNRIVRTPIGIFRFAVFTGALMFVCASGAYAQEGGKKNPDTGNIKMVIPGIPGDNVDGSIDVFAIDQQIGFTQPDDISTGRPTFAIMVTKGIDSASPRLSLFTVMRRPLAQRVIITLSKVDPATKEVSSYTIQLTNVSITSVRQMPANAKDPASKDSAEYEQIAFTFTRIEWTYRLPNGTQTHAGFDIAQGRPL